MAESKDAIVLNYRPAHPGEGFTGVPQRDLTQADIDELVGDARRHVLFPAVNPIYVPVEAKSAATAAPRAKKAKTAKSVQLTATQAEQAAPAPKEENEPSHDGEPKDGGEA